MSGARKGQKPELINIGAMQCGEGRSKRSVLSQWQHEARWKINDGRSFKALGEMNEARPVGIQYGPRVPHETRDKERHRLLEVFHLSTLPT